MYKLKELIARAKQKDVKAMEELFNQLGLEYEDVFQQGALLFILAVYEYQKKPPTTFAGYMKKRIDWGLWVYYRGYLKQ